MSRQDVWRIVLWAFAFFGGIGVVVAGIVWFMALPPAAKPCHVADLDPRGQADWNAIKSKYPKPASEESYSSLGTLPYTIYSFDCVDGFVVVKVNAYGFVAESFTKKR